MFELWYAIAALVFAIYVTLDGFDLGAGILSPFVARTDSERRQVLAAIGPYWDGNEVWLLAGGGVLFLAFPRVLASGISGLYFAIFLVLWCLLGRGIAIEFRSHVTNVLCAHCVGFRVHGSEHASRSVPGGRLRQPDARPAARLRRVVFSAAFHRFQHAAAGGHPRLVHDSHRRLRPTGVRRARGPVLDVEDGRPGLRAQPSDGAAALDRGGGAVAGGDRSEPFGEPGSLPRDGRSWAGYPRGRARPGGNHRGLRPAVARERSRSVSRVLRFPARRHRGERRLVLPGDAPCYRRRRPVDHVLHGGRPRGWTAHRAALVWRRSSARGRLLRGGLPPPPRKGGGRRGRRRVLGPIADSVRLQTGLDQVGATQRTHLLGAVSRHKLLHCCHQ